MLFLLGHQATALDPDRKNQNPGRQVAPAGTMPGQPSAEEERAHPGEDRTVSARALDDEIRSQCQVGYRRERHLSYVLQRAPRFAAAAGTPERAEPATRSTAGIQRSVRQLGASLPDRGHL